MVETWVGTEMRGGAFCQPSSTQSEPSGHGIPRPTDSTRRVGAWRICLCQHPTAIPPVNVSDQFVSFFSRTQERPVDLLYIAEAKQDMSGHEEHDDANAEDVGQTGPGAPTPLSQLEVRTECRPD